MDELGQDQEGGDVNANVDENGQDQSPPQHGSFNLTPPHHSTPIGAATAGIVDAGLLLQMMMEENRRRDDENRRREEMLMQEMRRRDEELRREMRRSNDEYRTEMRRLNNELHSQTGSSSSVTTMQEFRRRSDRCFREIRAKIEELKIQTNALKSERMLRIIDVIKEHVEKYNDFYENKIDLLDGNEEKDQLIADWIQLRDRALDEVYDAKAKLEKKKKIDSAGALPDKVKVPLFHGDLIHYPDWW